MDNPVHFYTLYHQVYWKEKPYISIKQQRLNDKLCGQT